MHPSVHLSSTLAFAFSFVTAIGSMPTGHAGDPPEFQHPVSGSIKLPKDLDQEDIRIHVSKNAILDIRKDQRMHVYRDGFSVAVLKVTEPTESGCIAEVFTTAEGVELKNGDRAILDTTLETIRLMEMDATFECKALAARFAKADLRHGLKRILYYGQGADPKAKDQDFETRYPLHAVAGCCVSKSLVEFVEEYNRIVREDFSSEDDKPTDRRETGDKA